MTKGDKRFCGICAESGHTSAECPRLGTASHAYAQVVEATTDWLYGMRADAREATARDCAHCAALEVEFAVLQDLLAATVTAARDCSSRHLPAAVTKAVTKPLAVTKPGRPKRYETPAERQRAYREEDSDEAG